MRRTKDESEQTRRHILTAARQEFARRGVTRTTLEDIAHAAGVTRGAIYWHFANKADLFKAMREQVTLPLVDRTDYALLAPEQGDRLTAIERYMQGLVAGVMEDKETRRTFEILSLKCEYVDELRPELARQVRKCNELLSSLTGQYREAAREGTLRSDLAPDVAALESCAFLVGLFRLAFLCGSRSDARLRANELIAAHVRARRSEPRPARPR